MQSTELPARIGRGGARPGAGRKPTMLRPRIRSFTLDTETVAKIADWKDARGAASLSEALRQIVDLADRRRRAVRKWGRSRPGRGVQTSAQTADPTPD